MKKLLFCALAGMMFIACQNEELKTVANEDVITQAKVTSQVIPGKYVVIYNNTGIQRTSRIASISGTTTITPTHVLALTKQILTESGLDLRTPELTYSSAVKGVVLQLTENEAIELAKSSSVKGVYPDMMVNFGLPEVSIKGKPIAPAPAQSIPWGITRIGGSSDGSGKTAWIIDTGIDLTHPDLNVDQVRGRNFVNTTYTPNDDNGHGTHCAGIVAALNNNIGVVGVAAGATVVPVKVLNKKGEGTMSAIIAGIDYVAANVKAGDAVNMSFGGGVYQPLDDAVLNLAAKGAKIAIAAGNESQNSNNCSPARVNGANIYTISAMGTGDLWASYSNYANPPIDFCAPGSSIYSTYKGGTYATLSGTSMATPHVCGILLLGNIQTNGYVKNDPDGNADPIAHK